MPDFRIANVELVLPGERCLAGSLLVRDGRIAAVEPGSGAPDQPGAAVVDGGGCRLTPGLIDIHTHGIETFMYEQDSAALVAGLARLGRYGTTGVVPTVVPRLTPAGLDHLAALAGALDQVSGVSAPGLHLEGPFMALAGAACDVRAGDLTVLDDLLAAARGRVAMMSLSPETPDILPVIARLRERGVVPCITHTRATVAQCQAAVDAGARHATHFYDVFPHPPETDPGVRPAGVVEVMLADPRTTVDFIADGCHVDPVAIRLAVRAKGAEGVLLVTDSNIGAGLPPGEYPTPWGYPVRVAPGRGARIADPAHPHCGALAGSALTMDVGIGNLLRWLDLPPAQIWALGTANPARLLGLSHKGVLRPGADADLVLWSPDGRPVRTWVRGTVVYERGDF